MTLSILGTSAGNFRAAFCGRVFLFCVVTPAPVLAAPLPHEYAHARAIEGLPQCNGINDCPQGVPDDFVRTPHGWFHPSCVVLVDDGEEYDASADAVVARDGSVRKLGPCAHQARDEVGKGFDAAQWQKAKQSSDAAAGVRTPPPLPTLNGWTASLQNETVGSVPTSNNKVGFLSAYWTVPNEPLWGTLTSSIIYLFPGLKAATIKQPVLGFNGLTGSGGYSTGWTLTAWDCCSGNNNIIMFGAPLPVSPGDSVYGEMLGSNCNTATGLCSTWTISAYDLNSGHGVSGTETGNTQIFGRGSGTVVAEALEVYNVDICPELPSNLGTNFVPVTVKNVLGAVVPWDYIRWTPQLPATSPNCQATVTHARYIMGTNYNTAATLGWWPNNRAKPNPPTSCGALYANQGIIKGQDLQSCDGRFRLTVQAGDGNVVLYQGGTPLWATGQYGTNISFPSEFIIMGGDGNFRQYSPTQAVWESGTSGNSNARLALQNDGNMVIYRANGTVAWASNTCCH